MSEEVKAHLREQIKAIESGRQNRTSQSQPYAFLQEKRAAVKSALPNEEQPEYSYKGEDVIPVEDKQAQKAFKRIVGLAPIRERSSAALSRRLISEGFSEASCDEALSRARNCGIIDDARFAEVLIRSRKSQGKGKQGIEAELRQHQIDPASLEGWPETFFGDENEELLRALDLLSRRPPRAKNARNAAFCTLIRKGYGAQCASSAARLWWENYKELGEHE